MFIVMMTDKTGSVVTEKFNNLDCALAFAESKKDTFSFRIQPLSVKASWAFKSAAN